MNFEILDIRFDRGMIYIVEKGKNFIVYTSKKQKLRTTDIEERLKSLTYSGQHRIKDPSVENAKLPSMITTFYKLIADSNLIPTEESFVKNYLSRYFDETNGGHFYRLKKQYQADNKTNYFSKEGLEGRILRAYPSLIRDFHFYLLCNESQKFDRVVYSTRCDIREGIDLKVEYKKETYAISLYVNTNRAQKFKKQKYQRHDYENLKEICVVLDLKNAKKINNFALYDASYIDDILKKISKYSVAV